MSDVNEYDAFISYRRSDGSTVARWLRRELEGWPTNLFATVSAAAVIARRGSPLVKIYDIGVFENVADAHVDTLAGSSFEQKLTM